MKKTIAVLMMLFMTPAFAHYGEPSPVPDYNPTIEHKHGTNVVNVAIIVAIVATVCTWLYCHFRSGCETK